VLAPVMGSPFTYCSAARLPGQEDPEATAPGQWRVNDLRGLYPPGGVNPETAILGVLGRPVTNSWSPLLHGMALKAAKLDAVYLPFEPEELEEFLALCDDENFRGFSVTAPYKQEALRLARESDALSEACGATNTLLRLGDHWRAANTDVPSVVETMEAAFRVHGQSPGRPVALGAARVVVLGAGGAARAVLQAVREAGGQAFVVARRAEAAEALCRELIGTPLALDALEGFEYDVLVNTTPAGSLAQPGELPLPEEWIRPETLVLDAVYRPISTPLLMAAKSRGCTAVPGGEWFVRQAAAQFQLFTGQEPNDALLRATFEHALGGER